jgi:predicted ATP-grasp superfamily ATP-dependent carboligase
MENKAVIVFSGYNIRAVIAFCRWATRYAVNFHIIARDETDPIFLTQYKKHVKITRTTKELRLAELSSWLDDIRRDHGYQSLLLLPSSEYLNRFLLENREALETANGVVPLVEHEFYTRISDKQSFAALCASHNLAIPPEVLHEPEGFPYVAKPRRYLSATGRQLAPYIIRDDSDKERFHQAEMMDEYFFQHYIAGRSLYLLAYLSRSGEVTLYSQENLIQQPRGGSIILARASDFHQTKTAMQYIEMLRTIQYFGLIMVELRLDEDRGTYYMIEANPRLWGPMQFVVDNDVGIFNAMLEDFGFSLPAAQSGGDTATHYYWSGGFTGDTDPVVFHHYSCEQFVSDYPALRAQDIFCRNDTINLFIKESQAEETHNG